MTKKRFFISTVIILLIGGSALVLLEIFNVTKFYRREQPSTERTDDVVTYDTPKPANTVDYSPAKDSDNVPIADKNPNEAPTDPNPDNLSVVITSTRKSSNGSNYLIKVGVSGTESGTCRATMTMSDVVVSATSDISLLGGQYGCTNLSIPMSTLNEGKWMLEVEVSNGQSKASVTSEVII